MRNYLLFLSCIILLSCNSAKKLHRMMDNLPEATAKECAERYPIKETVEEVFVADTALLLQYETEFQYMAHLIDSLLIANCDTVYIDKIKEKIKKIPCKPEVKYIIKTQESTAKLEAVQMNYSRKLEALSQINAQNVTNIHALEFNNSKLRTRTNWMWVIIVCLTVFSFRRQIAKMIV